MVALNRRAVMALALAVSSFALAPIASAVDTTWSNAAGGLWLEPTNWTAGAPNSSFDSAFLDGGLSNVPDTLVTLDLGDAFISIGQLAYSYTNGFNTRYDLVNGFLAVDTIRTNGFNSNDPEINVGLTTLSGTLNLGGGFFGEGIFTVNKPIGLQTNSIGDTFGTNEMRVRASGTFTAANTYTGRTIVADQLTLSDVDGVLASTGDSDTDITIRNGRLLLDNFTGANNNRVLDTARIGVKSGIISVTGSDGGTVSENLGFINLESGENQIELLQQGGTLTVSAAALTRTEGNRATLVLRNLGTSDPIEIGLDADIPATELIGGGSSGTTSAPVLPWATATVVNGETYLPVTYDSTARVLRSLNSSEYVLNSLSSGDNVVFDGVVAFPGVVNDIAVNSLSVPSGSAVNLGAKLTVTSGSLLLGSNLVFSGNPTIVDGTGSIEFGDATGYLLVAADFRRPEVATVINVPINTTGGLVKSGPGTLILGADQPGLSGGLTVNNGDLIPLTNDSLGTGTVTIAGGINGNGTGQQEARLFINRSLTLPNQLVAKTFGEYDGFGVLWHAPIVITNSATLTLTADPGGDSYFSLQNQFPTDRATLVLASPTARPPSDGFGVSINIVDNSEVILAGQTRNSVEAFGALAQISGSGETLNFLRLYSRASILIGNDGLSAETLTARSLDIFDGIFLFDIGGPANSDRLVLTADDSQFNPQFFIANLQLSLLGSYTPVTGDLITLIDSLGTVTSFNGTFAGKAEGQNFEFAGYNASLSYIGGDGNNLVLRIGTVIPEPASLALLAAPALLLTRRRR